VIGRLNHVGIAVPSIAAGLAVYRDLLGAEMVSEVIELPAQGVRACFVDLPNGQVELIEPLGEGSPLDRFLAKNPAGGQHHLCFEVPDIAAAVADMEAKGAAALAPPRIGAHGTQVVFLHPRGTGGVLVELMEAPDGHH
jgi:methylmalonyl-CoA/ethylmalonyl-CoA epimerase